MKIIAIDYGISRTGVAECDFLEITVTPRCVLKTKETSLLCEEISDIVKETNADLVVVGIPLNMDGTKGKQAEKTEKFAEKLKAKLKIPVVLRDEVLTTVCAEEFLPISKKMKKSGGQKARKQREKIIDALAAAVLLRGYLEER